MHCLRSSYFSLNLSIFVEVRIFFLTRVHFSFASSEVQASPLPSWTQGSATEAANGCEWFRNEILEVSRALAQYEIRVRALLTAKSEGGEVCEEMNVAEATERARQRNPGNERTNETDFFFLLAGNAYICCEALRVLSRCVFTTQTLSGLEFEKRISSTPRQKLCYGLSRKSESRTSDSRCCRYFLRSDDGIDYSQTSYLGQRASERQNCADGMKVKHF